MLLPLLFPVSQNPGVDPIHFGVIVTVNMTLGQITLPVGLCLALACRIDGISLERGVVAVWPFFLTGLTVLVVVTLVPELSTVLPGLVFD